MKSKKSFVSCKNSNFRIYIVSFLQIKCSQMYGNYCKFQSSSHAFSKGNRRVMR